jgi:hypothetical protein
MFPQGKVWHFHLFLKGDGLCNGVFLLFLLFFLLLVYMIKKVVAGSYEIVPTTKEAWYFSVMYVFIFSFILQVMQGLAKSVAWDGEGATCLIEVNCCCFLLVA